MIATGFSDDWYDKNKISEATKKTIEHIRTSPPSRRVQGGYSNVSGSYPSRKMGLSIQFESHSLELAYIYELEHDDDVLEYYDQPPAFKLAFENNGRNIGFMYTPDFFVIRKNSAGWVECKKERQLEVLAEKTPARYMKDDTETWRCPPGEEHANRLGLTFTVYSSAQVNPTLLGNLIFLEDYFNEKADVAPAFLNSVAVILKEEPGLSLHSLLAAVGTDHTDDLYRLIASRSIYASFEEAPFGEPKAVRVFRNKDIADTYCLVPQQIDMMLDDIETINWLPNENVIWDGKPFKILTIGDKQTYLENENGLMVTISNDMVQPLAQKGLLKNVRRRVIPTQEIEGNKILREASNNDLAKALKYHSAVKAYLNGLPVDDEIPLRTLQRKVKDFKEGEASFGDGLLGLIGKDSKKGSQTIRMPDRTFGIADEVIDKHYEDPRRINKKTAFGVYKNRCEEENVHAMCNKSFLKRLKKRPKQKQTDKREGHKAALKHKEFSWHHDRTVQRHGVRPFEVGHIDHTKTDLELISDKGVPLGRPWLSLYTDANTRIILAYHFDFDPPSAATDMTLIRKCVKKHSRVTQFTVTDWGSDSNSKNYQRLLARCESTPKRRPKSDPRSGSPCERTFGTVTTQFVNSFRGNTQNTKNVRTLTKETDPKDLAIWTLEEIDARFEEYLRDVYETNPHPALGAQTPRAAFESGIERFGQRPGRLIRYTEAFVILTLPTTPRGSAKVEPGRGVKIHGIYYWSDDFRNPAVEDKRVPVRYDPLNVGIAYAYVKGELANGELVKGQWVKCLSEYHFTLQGKSLKEIMLASAMIKKEGQIISSNFTVSAKKIADFYLKNRHMEDEKIMMQRVKDSAKTKKTKGNGDGNGSKPVTAKADLDVKKPSPKKITPAYQSADEIASYGEYE
jgi:putative transposase